MPELRAQFPWIDDLPPMPHQGEFQISAWLAVVEEEYGTTLPVEPAEAAGWVRFNALQDLSDVAPGKPVLVVLVDPEDDDA